MVYVAPCRRVVVCEHVGARGVVRLQILGAFCALISSFCAPSQAAVGDLDPRFGIGGKVILDWSDFSTVENRVFSGTDIDVVDAAVQGDGKIVVIANVLRAHGELGIATESVVARFTPFGEYDSTFDGDGRVIVAFDDSDPIADAIAQKVTLQPDGKIVIAGKSNVGSTQNLVTRQFLHRLHADGSVDVGFGATGWVVGQPAVGREVYGLVSHDTGEISVATSSDANFRGLGLIRYAADGSLLWQRETRFGGVIEGSRAMVQLPDGRLVVAGHVSFGGVPEIVLTRHQVGGELDPTFDGDGKVRLSSLVDEDAWAMTATADGKTIVVGRTNTPAAGWDYVLYRLLVDGSLDSTFGNAGKVVLPIGASPNGLRGVAVQNDGKIVVCGDTNVGDAGAIILRLHDDGQVDTQFGDEGRAVADIGRRPGDNSSSLPQGLVLAGDGGIITFGPTGGATGRGYLVQLQAGDCVSSACGDGVVGVCERCDDGNTVSGDGCDANCSLTGCGNGVVTSNEACDDGNATNADGCDSICTLSGCGSGVPTDSEVCDDGNGVNGDWCDVNCTISACGNGVAAPGEACDDGNETGGDGCEVDCGYTPLEVSVGPGQTVSTDLGGTGPTASIPVQLAMTLPVGGSVSVRSDSGVEDIPKGFSVAGTSFRIEAPAGSIDDPLVLRFEVDSSAFPTGIGAEQIAVGRDGEVIAACGDASGAAVPDPCVEGSPVEVDGTVAITVRSSHASVWAIGTLGLSKTERSCVNGSIKSGNSVVKAQVKAGTECLARVADGVEADPQACLVRDDAGKVAAALQKTSAFVGSKCIPAPAFGSISASEINQIAVNAGIRRFTDLFGENLNLAASSDAATAKCQTAILKGTTKFADAANKILNSCQALGLAGKSRLFTSADSLAACVEELDFDRDGKLAKATGKLASSIASKCSAVDLDSAIPGGCGQSSLPAECIARRARCRACRYFLEVQGLDRSCDFIDDQIQNSSCH